MMKENEVKEIKKLIKQGFDLKLLSFELDIPIEEIRQCKLELEESQKSNVENNYRTRERGENKNQCANLRFEEMRKRYNKLFFENNGAEIKQPKKLQEQERELIHSVIEEVEEEIKKIEGLSKIERRKAAKNITEKLKKIRKYQLTVEQAEKLHYLLDLKTLENLSLISTDKIDYYVDSNRKMIIRKLIEAVYYEQDKTDDLDELKSLEKKLTLRIQKSNPVFAGTVKTRIGNKILKINQQILINRIRNDVTDNIESIISALANGTLDIESADKIIQEEARKRKENKSKNRFALTEEQEKKQILIQIKTNLIEKAEQYHIKNPKKTIELLQKLYGGDEEQVIRIVVKNLTNQKDFKRAKEICDEFSRKNEEGLFPIYIYRLKKEIRNYEISDMILKGINMNGTPEEEKSYFELIEKGLKMGNIKLDAISLGKSQDGLRTITLADIWTEEKERTK